MLLNEDWSRMILGLRANEDSVFLFGKYKDPIIGLVRQGYSLRPSIDAEEVASSYPTKVNGKCSLITAMRNGVDVEYDVASVYFQGIEWSNDSPYRLNSKFAECATMLQRDIDHENGMVKIHNV